MSWVFDQAPTRRSTDQLVLLAIADRCNDDGLEAWPSLPTLASKTRLSERAVWGAIRRLVGIGVLRVVPGRGRVRSNHYQVVMEPCTTCEVAGDARSHDVRGQLARRARSASTTCEVKVARRASNTSSTSKTSSPRARAFKDASRGDGGSKEFVDVAQMLDGLRTALRISQEGRAKSLESKVPETATSSETPGGVFKET